MQIHYRLKRNFPKLADWIIAEIPKCRHDARIWSPFLRFGQLSEEQAISALSFNLWPPTIDIRIQRGDGTYRAWFKRNRDKIFITRKLCRVFEKPEPDIRIMIPYDLLMKATILHEMVHWGDFNKDRRHSPDKNIYDPITQQMLKMDVGSQFEMEAFGFIITREWLRIL